MDDVLRGLAPVWFAFDQSEIARQIHRNFFLIYPTVLIGLLVKVWWQRTAAEHRRDAERKALTQRILAEKRGRTQEDAGTADSAAEIPREAV